MKFFNHNLWYIVLCVIILSNSSFPGSDEVRKNGEILYLTNKIVLKLKDFPSVQTDGSATLPSGLNAFLEQFQINKVAAAFPFKANLRSGSLGNFYNN